MCSKDVLSKTVCLISYLVPMVVAMSSHLEAKSSVIRECKLHYDFTVIHCCSWQLLVTATTGSKYAAGRTR